MQANDRKNAPNKAKNTTGPQKKQKMDAASSKNVRVVGRIRPLAAYEVENGSKPCVVKIPSLNDGGPETLQINEGEKRWFELDAILDSDSTQLEVYEKSGAHKAISDDIFQGFNCTILAYGQTGAGTLKDLCSQKANTLQKDRKRSIFEICAISLTKLSLSISFCRKDVHYGYGPWIQ